MIYFHPSLSCRGTRYLNGARNWQGFLFATNARMFNCYILSSNLVMPRHEVSKCHTEPIKHLIATNARMVCCDLFSSDFVMPRHEVSKCRTEPVKHLFATNARMFNCDILSSDFILSEVSKCHSCEISF